MKTTLTPKQRKRFRAIGHTLVPAVTIAGNGLSTPVSHEIERALDDHELIKLKITATDRTGRKSIIDRIQEEHNAELIQTVGGMALIHRASSKPGHPALSNITRSGIL